MKKPVKLIIGAVVLLSLATGIQQGLKYYLQGPKRAFNALLISGDLENVNKAKDIYKDNTEYTKDYKYKTVVNSKKTKDKNGKEIVYEEKFLVLNKDTAKEMLKDQVIRVKKDQNPESGNIQTSVLEEIKDIDTDKNIFLGDRRANEDIQINDKKIDLEQDKQSWIGYYPDDDGYIMIVDDNTYNSIQDKEKTIGLIKFNKGTKDLRNAKEKNEPKEKLSGIENIEIDYVNTKN